MRDAQHGEVPEQPTPQEPGTRYYDLDDDDSVPELGGSRPDSLLDVSGPQERVQRHFVEQIVDSVPGLSVLGAPVPQEKQLADVLMLFDTMMPDVEQVIEVPKIILDQVSQRSSLRGSAAGGTVGGSANNLVFPQAES